MPPSSSDRDPGVDRLAAHLERHARWFVLTGAGVSTASGIPDYRDADGGWKRNPPVTYQAFTGDPLTRARYWARSLIGWPRIDAARPSGAHRALAALEAAGRVTALVTQNVDGLHQRAGSARVIDLHGRLDGVVCLDCGARSSRADLQRRLEAANPAWVARAARLAAVPLHSDGTPTTVGAAADGDPIGATASPAAPVAGPRTAPDGDVDLDADDFADFQVPPCTACGGVLKPDVVFFGENVPRPRVADARAALHAADAMLVAGSSLMVFSGFRFAREAAQRGLPVVAVNLGRTRADELLADKIAAPCDVALPAALAARRPVQARDDMAHGWPAAG